MPERLHPALRALLAEDWAAVDPALPLLLEGLPARGAGEAWHPAGTLRDHLLGLGRTLTLWDQPREVRLLGLVHGVHGSQGIGLPPAAGEDDRAALAAALGPEAERRLHTARTLPRGRFVRRLLEEDALPGAGLVLEREGAPAVILPAREVAVFAIVTIADLAGRWHSWQDEILAGFPSPRPRPVRENWAASLWPGPLRPTATALSLLSRLGRVLSDLPEEWGLPTPPVFARCTAGLDPAEEMAAAALYWQAVTRGLPMVGLGPTHRALETCIGHNPHVGEPRLLLAQLALVAGDWAMAAGHARAGLDLLQDWGVAWDKRIAWPGWVAWARLLLRSAEARRWPESLDGLEWPGTGRGPVGREPV